MFAAATIVVRRSASIAACVLAASSVVGAAPVLRSADLKITITSPTSCDVAMALAIDGGTDIDHRIESFEGGRIELAVIRGARQVDGVRAIGRSQSLVLRPDGPSYEFGYRAVQPAGREHRCPIWLPAVPTDGRSQAVRIEVDLPAAAIAGASMPAFTWTGSRGAARLGHVPAVVIVPFAPQGEARGWGIDSLMDAFAIAVFVGASGVWAWRLRR
jgi:hypothetical protein